jgi:hypothetical protein
MKVCPVCNETFADELKFCDLDGTRLKREIGTQSPEKQNKTWSLIGVGLLVGALVLSALSIIFLPKARIAPTVANSETGQAVTSSRPDSGQTEIAQTGSADSQAPEILVEEPPAAELKKKDPALSLVNGNLNSTTPDPKAAAKEPGEDELPAAQVEPPPVAPPPPPKEIDPTPSVKPDSDVRDADAKTAASADPKKDAKKSKDVEDEKKSDKKGDDKKKKKGGGLFGAFKKIFGKN